MAKDYAIVPEKEVLQLKQDVDAIKKNPFQAYGTGNFIDAVNDLTKAVNSLIDLFKTAAEEMKLEEREAETIAKSIEPMFSKIDTLVNQNEKIARGIVAVADMMENSQHAKPSRPTSYSGSSDIPPGQGTLPKTQMPPRPIVQGRPGMPPPMGAKPMPPMPPRPKPGMGMQAGMPGGPSMMPPPSGMAPPPSPGMPLPPPPAKKKGFFG